MDIKSYLQEHARNRRALAGVAAVLAVALVIAGFAAVFVPHLQKPTARLRVTPQATSLSQSIATPQLTGTSQPTGFVCANPQGSSMTYAYTRGDGHVYAVTGCAAPRELTSTNGMPVAWSPSNRYLAISLQGSLGPSQLEVIDTQTGTVISTHYTADFGSGPNLGRTTRIFFGWLADTAFLGAITTLVTGPENLEAPGNSTLVRVDLHSGSETAIGTIPGWVAFGLGLGPAVRVVANGHELFYAAYTGSTAYLQRFDLTTGIDTRLVSLGLYTYGGCQGTNVCGWTAPWDVSSDGSHILYHYPGASSPPTDINIPKDTPIFYANPNGSGATRPFGTGLAVGLVEPIFSPSGSLAVATGSTYSGTDPFTGPRQMELTALGAPYTTVSGGLVAWRGDNQALIIWAPQAYPGVYNIATGAVTPLEANSNFYLWGH